MKFLFFLAALMSFSAGRAVMADEWLEDLQCRSLPTVDEPVRLSVVVERRYASLVDYRAKIYLASDGELILVKTLAVTPPPLSPADFLRKVYYGENFELFHELNLDLEVENPERSYIKAVIDGKTIDEPLSCLF